MPIIRLNSGLNHLEMPLWIFVGSSVNAVYSEDKEKKSDVLRVVLFLRPRPEE